MRDMFYSVWGRIDEMADEGVFKSETYDNCNCAVNCGCQFNLPTTRGYCQSAFVGNLVEGRFNDYQPPIYKFVAA